jgi:hypothetical protein
MPKNCVVPQIYVNQKYPVNPNESVVEIPINSIHSFMIPTKILYEQCSISGNISIESPPVGPDTTSIQLYYQIIRDKSDSVTNGRQLLYHRLRPTTDAFTYGFQFNITDMNVGNGKHEYEIILYNESSFNINLQYYSFRINSLYCSKKSLDLCKNLPKYYTNQQFPRLGEQNAITIPIDDDKKIEIPRLYIKKCCGKVVVTGNFDLGLPISNIDLNTNVEYNILRDGETVTHGFQTARSIVLGSSLVDQSFPVSINYVDNNLPKGHYIYSIIIRNKSNYILKIHSYSFRARSTNSISGGQCCRENSTITKIPMLLVAYNQNFPILGEHSFPLIGSKLISFPKVKLTQKQNVNITGSLSFNIGKSLSSAVINIMFNIYRNGESISYGNKKLFYVITPGKNIILPGEINFTDLNVDQGKYRYDIEFINMNSLAINVDTYSFRLEYY